MLPKKNRLQTKEVRYLQHRRKVFFTTYFSFTYVPQYANNHYHQLSIYIAKKYLAHAVDRHYLKRKLLTAVEKTITESVNGCFMKVFIGINKRAFPQLQELRTQDKKKCTQFLVGVLERDRQFFLKNTCKSKKNR